MSSLQAKRQSRAKKEEFFASKAAEPSEELRGIARWARKNYQVGRKKYF
jgi:hypothetical protein